MEREEKEDKRKEGQNLGEKNREMEDKRGIGAGAGG